MKKFAPLFVLLFLATCSLAAQTVDTTVCDILANPASFDGKIVKIKGTVIAGFDEFLVKAGDCSQPANGIWLAYPEGTRAKAGPAAVVFLQLAQNNTGKGSVTNRATVKLDKNKDFKQFDSLLATPAKSGGSCLACSKYTVTATLVGRLDGVKEAGLERDAGGKVVGINGFGTLGRYSARLVLQSVSDVLPQEIDYSKSAALPKDEPGGGGDPVAASHQAAKAFPSGSAAAEQMERAAAAFGKEGEANGVEVGFGTANEVPKGDGAKGDKNSPDGVLFNCTFDTDRLKGGDALGRAIAHMGAHVADIRDTQSKDSLYTLEDRAWQTTVLNAVAFRQKSLVAPGSHVLWNSAWPAAERNKQVGDGISSYLVDWVALKK